jgi:hypothetical protein
VTNATWERAANLVSSKLVALLITSVAIAGVAPDRTSTETSATVVQRSPASKDNTAEGERTVRSSSL